MSAANPEGAQARKTVNLALQGGGAHGAFTWGVLDALLEDGRLDIAAISGASAGAMNAVVCAAGLQEGGAPGAREKLKTFWSAVSAGDPLADSRRKPLERWLGRSGAGQRPATLFLAALGEFAGPYHFNPFDVNPLRGLVATIVDFDALRAEPTPGLFIAATDARTGEAKIFSRETLTADHLMASACLPSAFQAVVIDGVAYWDGGFSANPPLWPLARLTPRRDTIIVQINPVSRPETPRTPREISNRIHEITFNASLVAELREAAARAEASEILHRIGGDSELEPLSESTKADVSWRHLESLRDRGRQAAASWLERNFDSIGVRGTLHPAEPRREPPSSLRQSDRARRAGQALRDLWNRVLGADHGSR